MSAHWQEEEKGWLEEAYQEGKAAAEATASWSVDGNSDLDERRRVLKMLEDGNPQAFDYLPAEPNLSGTWSDDLTPVSLARHITGEGPRYVTHGASAPEREDVAPELIDALCDEWERGVSENFESACEAELRKAVA